MRDAFAAWKLGITAGVMVHEPFAMLAKTQCQVLGAKDPLILVYKQDAPARESDEDSEVKAREVATDIMQLLSSRG